MVGKKFTGTSRTFFGLGGVCVTEKCLSEAIQNARFKKIGGDAPSGTTDRTAFENLKEMIHTAKHRDSCRFQRYEEEEVLNGGTSMLDWRHHRRGREFTASTPFGFTCEWVEGTKLVKKEQDDFALRCD